MSEPATRETERRATSRRLLAAFGIVFVAESLWRRHWLAAALFALVLGVAFAMELRLMDGKPVPRWLPAALVAIALAALVVRAVLVLGRSG